VYVPGDFFRAVRGAVRAWGLIVLLVVANAIVLVLYFRTGGRSGSRTAGGVVSEFPPALRLKQQGTNFIAPDVIAFPARGKLRIGYHPPYVDKDVGSRDFARLPHQDIRGAEDAIEDLSRHVACIWRDDKTNDCYIQLGWPGPGRKIQPRPQSAVYHFNRFNKPEEATATPYRLVHNDVVRLGTGIEFVFTQVGLRDRPTQDSKKLSPFERTVSTVNGAGASSRRQTVPQESMAEEG
jgi:hypothetical protein